LTYFRRETCAELLQHRSILTKNKTVAEGVYYSAVKYALDDAAKADLDKLTARAGESV
jgi:hypothetical protein